jgi:hypothetical protein
LNLTEEQKASLPTDKKIAFNHPTHDGIIVFIWSDMPHWTKKLVNALERMDFPDSDTNLNFEGQPLSLQMQMGQASVQTSSERSNFEKDSYSRM